VHHVCNVNEWLFLDVQTVYSTFTGLWYGQEKLGYPVLLILLKCYTINICAVAISLKVISLQLKGYTSRKWQFHVVQQQQSPYRSLDRGKCGDKWFDLP
jgi:hypothetical protein